MSETKIAKVQMSVWVPEDLRKRAKAAAALQGQSLTDMVTEALEDYLEALEDIKDAKAAVQAWRADPSTARPWEEFEAELAKDGLLDEQ
jgi:predicted DNA-binding protein